MGLCVRAMFYSFCQSKESMYYGKEYGSENTGKSDEQE